MTNDTQKIFKASDINYLQHDGIVTVLCPLGFAVRRRGPRAEVGPLFRVRSAASVEFDAFEDELTDLPVFKAREDAFQKFIDAGRTDWPGIDGHIGHPELDDLCLDEIDLPADTPTSYVGIWGEWRDAVRAHLACIAKQDAEYHARQEQFRLDARHIGLPTSFARGMAQRLWEDAAAKQRTLGGVPTHGYVAKTRGKYEAVCPEHPRFRLVAWSRQSIPLQSAREHNVEYHGGAPARVYDAPGRVLNSMLS